MSDQPSASAKVGGAIGNWIKTMLASLLALVSGAVLMYASPLVDRVIKPAPPKANFECQIDGLKVTFHNRSTGGIEGFWDFGDGSALEPFTPGQETLVHTYAKVGQYTAKLAIQNLIDAKDERSVNVNLDGSAPVAQTTQPTIDAFDVTPLSPEGYAPATFKVSSKFKNANLCVWAFGHEYPLEIVPAANTSPERLVTFKQPGTHVIKLAVSNGKDVIERTQVVKVTSAPKDVPVAFLIISQEAVQVEIKETRPIIAYDFPSNVKDATYKFSRDIPIEGGYEVTKYEFSPPIKDAAIKDPKLQVTADKRMVKFTCDVVKQSGGIMKKESLPRGSVQIALTMEKRTPSMRPPQQIAQILRAPGTTTLPLPALPPGWTAGKAKMDMELRNNDKVLWHSDQMPKDAPLVLNGRTYTVNAVTVDNQVRIEVRPAGNGPRPLGGS